MEYAETREIFQKLGVPSHEATSKDVYTTEIPPLHALIIGINDYPDQPLYGAVQDALRVEEYLTQNLHVPKSQIQILLDREATRQRIIDELCKIRANDKINPGDPILIYYAGHGTKLPKPDGWEASEDYIQALVPQDIGGSIHAIPDRTIAKLLNNIGGDKGNNVTVILDCCYSASGTRLPAARARLGRYFIPTGLAPIPNDIDEDIIDESKYRIMKVNTRSLHKELRSHVLLSACAVDELAYETDKAGDFTTALITTLIESGVDRTTYRACIQRLPTLQNQHPQCEGFHKDRVIFNARVPGAHRKLILVTTKDNKSILNAGTAQGITPGAKFNIFNTDIANPTSTRPLGSMRVTLSRPAHSEMTWDDDLQRFTLPEICYGFQTHCGTSQYLKVHFTRELLEKLSVDDNWHRAFTASQTNVVIQPCSRSRASVIVDLKPQGTPDRVSFEIRHTLIDRYGVNKLPHTVPLAVDDIMTVLRASALWMWHLDNNPESSLGDSIKLEFRRVEPDMMLRLGPVGQELNKSGVVDIVAKSDEMYGIRLVNESPYDLFPYLFYFDVNQQSIDPWNDTTVGKNHAVAPLRRGGSLTIGYGAGGVVPFSFAVGDDNELELGMLKLYVTNLATEFSSIEHVSPFTFGPDGNRHNVSQTEVARSLAMRGVWHTVTVALVQRKHEYSTV